MKTSAHIITATMLLTTMPLITSASTSGDNTISTILALWPYLVGLILVLLAFLWYQQIRLWMRSKEGKVRRHTARGNQLTMLGLVTIFALLMIAAPRLLKRFENSMPQQTEQKMDTENRAEITLQVEGMTCTGCEAAVQNRVAGMQGVEYVKADHVNKKATVVYDKSRTNPDAIAQTIEDTGYKVVQPL